MIQRSKGVSVAFLVVADSSSPQLLDGNEYSDTVSNLLDSHLFQHELVAFDEVATSDIVDYKDESVFVWSK